MDPIKAYLKDVRHIPLLSAEEEITLAKKVRKGDKEARNKMIRSNLLTVSIPYLLCIADISNSSLS